MAKKKLSEDELAIIKQDESVIASVEFQKNTMAAKLNWLRAGVLGANDGIVSTCLLYTSDAADE